MSDIKDNGGSAFPVVGHFYGDKLGGQLQHGMTMRDYFAAKAMQFIGQNANLSASNEVPESIAELAYMMADAMLAERAK